MAKFKMGDKVRILDGSGIKDYIGGWTSHMVMHVGEIAKITGTIVDKADGRIGYKLQGNVYTWDERGLKPAVDETIVVFRKGGSVVALDRRSGKQAIIDNADDFGTSAKLAFEQLFV